MESQESNHPSSLKQVSREPAKSSSQRRSSKVSFDLEMPVASKKILEHKRSQGKLHSQHMQPPVLQQQQQQQQAGLKAQPSAQGDKQPRERKTRQQQIEKQRQESSTSQPPAKQKKHRPKKEASLQEFSSELEVDHNQLETEMSGVQEEQLRIQKELQHQEQEDRNHHWPEEEGEEKQQLRQEQQQQQEERKQLQTPMQQGRPTAKSTNP